MSTKTERLAEYITEVASGIILERLQGIDDTFGVVSVIETVISQDRSYADIYVSSERNTADLPKQLANYAGAIRSTVSRNVSMWKAPIIRFRTQQGDTLSEADRVKKLIEDLSSQYGLSHED